MDDRDMHDSASRALRPALLLPALLLASPPAAAQFGGMGDGRGGMNRPGAMGNGPGAPRGRALTPVPAPPPPVLQADPWPRLDAGAVLCRSLDDLRRRAARMADPDAAGPPPNCRRLAAMLPVTILGREGPGATQVQTTAPRPETGWTDAWMPERGTQAPLLRPGQGSQGGPGGRRPDR